MAATLARLQSDGEGFCMTRKVIAVLLLFLAVTYSVGTRADAASRIAMYGSDDLLQCWLETEGPGLVRVYVVHNFALLSNGVRFRIVPSSGFGMVYQNETIHVDGSNIIGYVGNSQDGLEIQYAGCPSGHFLLATITYASDGTTPACSYLQFAAHPEAPSGKVEIRDCHLTWQPSDQAENLYLIPPGEACPHPLWCLVSPTEHGTWGSIKALYE